MSVRSRYILSIVLASLVIAGVVLVLWAKGWLHGNSQQYKVLCINSYGAKDANADYEKLLEKAFDTYDLNVDYKIYWRDYNGRRGMEIAKDWADFRVQMDSAGWKPDVLLVDGSLATYYLMGYDYDYAKQFPIVFCNVVSNDTVITNQHSNVTGFLDEIDLGANAELVRSLTGKNEVLVELDDNPVDSMLRELFVQTVADTSRFVCYDITGDLSLKSELARTTYKDKIVCEFLSLKNVVSNSGGYEPNVVDELYSRSRFIPCIQANHDAWSNLLVDYSGSPQYTATCEQFNAKSHCRFYAGYFSSKQTQLNDAVSYIDKILRGFSPAQLTYGQHKKNFYMDYRGMEILGLNYDDYSDRFIIINAPFRVAHKRLLMVMHIASALLFFVVLGFVSYKKSIYSVNEVKRELNYLRDMMRVRNKVFDSTGCTPLYIDKSTVWVDSHFASEVGLSRDHFSLKEFRENVVEEVSRESFDMIFDEGRTSELDIQLVRLRLSFNGGQNYHWWDFVYSGTSANHRRGQFPGLIIEADRQQKEEDKLLHALEAAEGIRMRERFLANISHDLRTPLGAIVGFANLLTEDRKVISDEEKRSFAQIIQNNTDMMLGLLNEVVGDTQAHTGDVSLSPELCHVSSIVRLVYESNNVQKPQNLDFLLEEYPNDLLIFADYNRMIQVVNNLVANAMKFTPQGFVKLGWRYVAASNEVEIYVQDSGIGISEEGKQNLFTRFYRAEEKAAQGTGLGLSISKSIVERLGGSIRLESELGKGSTFTVVMKNVKR